MHTLLLVFEFLGTTELLVIALVALILFGPRKLPEIGRMVGKSIGEFKRASDDFKRTWEFEVELEQRKHVLDTGNGAQQVAAGAVADAGAGPPAAGMSAEEFVGHAAQVNTAGETVARDSAAHAQAGADEDEINPS